MVDALETKHKAKKRKLTKLGRKKCRKFKTCAVKRRIGSDEGEGQVDQDDREEEPEKAIYGEARRT